MTPEQLESTTPPPQGTPADLRAALAAAARRNRRWIARRLDQAENDARANRSRETGDA